ncbi:MAG: hypothetical protein IKZ45_00910 [Fibrobacter sp.]|nr:hypothetical protein [Fibrobacter sp.]
MKKIFLAAVIGASFLFTACGDDSSSSPNTDTQDVEKKDGDTPSKDNGTVIPEPNGTSHQGCWYTSDATSVTEYEVTAVGVITRIWTIEDGKVMKSTDYNDGTEPMIDEEYSMSSLNDAIEMEKGVCKKM